MPRENLSETIEDYLKTIYRLTSGGKRATTNQISAEIGVTPASVTEMLKKLSKTSPPLIEYRRHRGAILTLQGEQVALEIIRHHRLLEMFLQQILGYGWDQVHDEADRLEHVISEEFEERMARALGNPSHDPHGDPIPTRDLILPESSSKNLSSLRPGQRAIVSRVQNTDPELLRYLASLNILPGNQVNILDYSTYDGNLTISINEDSETVVLGPPITRQIFIELL